jgi:hypothetical protein
MVGDEAFVILDELIVHGLYLHVFEAKLHFYVFDCLMLAPRDNVPFSQNSLHRAITDPLKKPEWPRQYIWEKMGKMWQAGDVGVLAANGYYKTALEQITARVMVMPSQTDRYFVVDDGEPEAKNPKNGKFNPTPTIWGHIGGGANKVDTKWVDGEISQFLSEGVLGELEGFG